MTLDEIPIREIWQQLGGGALKGNGTGKLRGIAFWRKGANGFNVSVDTNRNVWFDFMANEGGGNLRLVERARGCDQASALQWLELYGNLTPTRPLTPLEERRRRVAEQEAQDLLRWREELLESLRARRNRNWKLYHQSKDWILKFSLGNMRGCLLAEVADIAEEIALETDAAIQKLSEQDWDTWLRLYRGRIEKAA